jgi:capsid portal protein
MPRLLRAAKNGNGKHSERDLTENRNYSLSFIEKASPDSSRQIKDPFTQYYSEGRVLAPVLPLEKLWAMYEQNAVHGACVNAKADDSVGSGWKLVPEDDDGDQNEETTKEAEQSVRERLDAVTRVLTFPALLRQAVVETEATGFGAWEIVRDKPGGSILAIYPVPVQTVRICFDRARYDSDEEYYMQIFGAMTRYFVAFGSEKEISSTAGPDREPKDDDDRASEILCFRHYSPTSPYYGYPRWSAAIPAIAEFNAIREFNLSFFSGSGQADRLIAIKTGKIQESDRLVNSLREQIRDAKGFAHVTLFAGMTAEAALEVTELQGPVPREASFVRRREDLVKEILMAHQVPPYRVGWAELGSLGGSAATEMLRAYRTGSIEPLQLIFESRINKDLFGEKGFDLAGYRFELVDIDWDRAEQDVQKAVATVNAGISTPNEAREMVGLSKHDMPGLDEHYVNGNPLGQPQTPPPGAGGVPPALAGVETNAQPPTAEAASAVDDERPGFTHGLEEDDEAIRVQASNQAREDEKKRAPHVVTRKRKAAQLLEAERKAVVDAVRGAGSVEEAEEAVSRAVDETVKKKSGNDSLRTST